MQRVSTKIIAMAAIAAVAAFGVIRAIQPARTLQGGARSKRRGQAGSDRVPEETVSARMHLA
jgi:hypothetical protein